MSTTEGMRAERVALSIVGTITSLIYLTGRRAAGGAAARTCAPRARVRVLRGSLHGGSCQAGDQRAPEVGRAPRAGLRWVRTWRASGCVCRACSLQGSMQAMGCMPSRSLLQAAPLLAAAGLAAKGLGVRV